MADLEQELGMSVSSFYKHFKSVTAITPLQFQKRVRLQEARWFMLGEGMATTIAAYKIGDNDAAHFSRGDIIFFGQPPLQDIKTTTCGNLDKAVT